MHPDPVILVNTLIIELEKLLHYPPTFPTQNGDISDNPLEVGKVDFEWEK